MERGQKVNVLKSNQKRVKWEEKIKERWIGFYGRGMKKNVYGCNKYID